LSHIFRDKIGKKVTIIFLNISANYYIYAILVEQFLCPRPHTTGNDNLALALTLTGASTSTIRAQTPALPTWDDDKPMLNIGIVAHLLEVHPETLLVLSNILLLLNEHRMLLLKL